MAAKKPRPIMGAGPAPSVIPARLLAWYDAYKRDLPWRTATPDPYRVWLSEVMLQQTTVAAVISYYNNFTTRWPTVTALAAAPLDDVLAAWSGLGYYARARNLHKAAQAVAAQGGRFPNTIEGLMALPGIGAYTAGAIGAIAFGIRAAAVDANAERVIARLFAITEPMPGARAAIRAYAEDLVPVGRPGDFAQSLMDLGSSVCTQRPDCAACPLQADCAACAQGLAATLPVKAPKKAKPQRRAVAFVAQDKAGRVLLVQRPDKGLLASMWQPPMTALDDAAPDASAVDAARPFTAHWTQVPGAVQHSFTHFDLEVVVWCAPGADRVNVPGRWQDVKKLDEVGLPTVMRKILRHCGIAG